MKEEVKGEKDGHGKERWERIKRKRKMTGENERR